MKVIVSLADPEILELYNLYNKTMTLEKVVDLESKINKFERLLKEYLEELVADEIVCQKEGSAER